MSESDQEQAGARTNVSGTGPIGALPETGSPYLSPCLALTVYFLPDLEAYRNGVVACLEEFVGDWGTGIQWYADEDLGKYRPVSAKRLARARERLLAAKPIPFFAWRMLSGDSFQHAGALSCTGLVRDPLAWAPVIQQQVLRKLCFLRASFPVAAFDSTAGIRRFAALVERWTARLPVLHGYAGLALNQPAPSDISQMNSAKAWDVARRFPGCDVENCGSTVLVAQEAIKGVNWLTILGGAFVAQLGGAESLREQLSPGVELHALPGDGLIVQAGPAPLAAEGSGVGDLDRYREVARVLRPVRLQWHPDLGPAEYGSFGAAGTAAWLHRFDNEA